MLLEWPRLIVSSKNLKPKMIFRVKGSSLEPTLKPNSLVLAIRSKKAIVGDFVIFKHSTKLLIKKVVSVNELGIYVVGYSSDSQDSRSFGVITKDQLIARVIMLF